MGALHTGRDRSNAKNNIVLALARGVSCFRIGADFKALIAWKEMDITETDNI